MAADAPQASIDWNSLSEEERIEEQKEMIKILSDEDTLTKFGKACENIGQTAVSIDVNFRTVKNGFAKIVDKYGEDFPDVERVFVPRWDGYMDRWGGEKGILWSSRALAAKTVTTLDDYGQNLGFIADIKTEEDLEKSKLELADYVKNHPIDVGKEVADGFKKLKSDIQMFSRNFAKYIEDQRQTLTDEAKKYEAEIKECQKTITQCLAAAAVTLVVSFALGIVEGLVAIGPLAVAIANRVSAQVELDNARANLRKTVSKQKALAAMQVDFEQLKPNIDDICNKLRIFVDIWTFTAEQSAGLKLDLQKGMKVLTTEAFQVKLHLLIAQIEPLKEGMRKYYTQIAEPPK
ncbi:hypothetical protein AGABI1DRAFT_102284 [Agaricus bisporus var. burnettii JB137-S8]|uniref:Uncharacterized protein n=1 Tax=Agaricus bisporus var. burnettii (strain JB137-S8 / ATCC MYA-4627 / FGSC 10392) TaxID=597362 RepID=K5WZX1_AGABU|nr:uncharacterized protein AGABI1DRAFT_102284 [Agaricus bisporus var. burnettii JB137-S8]EKM76413.1 hypothetical protein AGABI1DRAFT_102284 [Agaricus bisporus var. burnettii JB137-S8]